MPPELRVVDDLPQAAVQLFLEESPRVVLLTGGMTARNFYERLAVTQYPWEEVECFFTDPFQEHLLNKMRLLSSNQ